jgi:hypothetical protein
MVKLNYYAPRHEAVLGSACIAPPFLTSEIEVSNQFHASATLPPGKVPPVSIE